jgi:gas vesicle protein
VRKETSSLSTGFFVGTLVGGAIALLFAPQSGEETRAQIRRKNSELQTRAREACIAALDGFENATRAILKRIEAFSARLNKAHTWDKYELARWQEELEAIEEASEEALAEARME